MVTTRSGKGRKRKTPQSSRANCNRLAKTALRPSGTHKDGDGKRLEECVTRLSKLENAGDEIVDMLWSFENAKDEIVARLSRLEDAVDEIVAILSSFESAKDEIFTRLSRLESRMEKDITMEDEMVGDTKITTCSKKVKSLTPGAPHTSARTKITASDGEEGVAKEDKGTDDIVEDEETKASNDGEEKVEEDDVHIEKEAKEKAVKRPNRKRSFTNVDDGGNEDQRRVKKLFRDNEDQRRVKKLFRDNEDQRRVKKLFRDNEEDEPKVTSRDREVEEKAVKRPNRKRSFTNVDDGGNEDQKRVKKLFRDNEEDEPKVTSRDREVEEKAVKRPYRKRSFTKVDDGGNEDQRRVKKLFRDNEEDEPKVTSRDREVPLTELDVHGVLFNSIMDVDDGVVEEPVVSPHKSNDTKGSSESDDDSEGSEKAEEETEVDSMYKMLGFCLACDENDDENDATNIFLEEEEAELDAKKSREQLCNEGKHHFILEEETGILCKSCGFVREEIRYVMPPFHENPFGYSDGKRYSMYDRRDGGDRGDRPCIKDLDSQYYCDKDDANFDPNGTVWELIPGIRRTLLPHQREAFEFIWRNVAGGTKLDELVGNDITEGGGCLISHAPGTGKTRLAIAFLETYMKFYKNSRPVILAPAGILLTWKKEFDKWNVGIPFQSLIDEDLSKDEATMAISLGINLDRHVDKTTKRLVKLLFWKKHDSVIAISYTLFAQLASGGETKKTTSSSSRCLDETNMFREMLLDRPGLLILDEGHMPRNERSCLFKVLSEVKTKRRFILSGTPFQNNFRELHNILGLVMPRICEKSPFNKSVKEADEEMIQKLKSEIEPFFHCYEGDIVVKMVPGLNDNLVFLEPSELQKKLFRKVDSNPPGSNLEKNVATMLISVHPRLFGLKEGRHDFAKDLKSGKWDIADGAKLRFLLRLIELSLPLKEKVLVFSEYLHPLNLVKALLESSDHFGWQEGREILVMSGHQDMSTRKKNMEIFNKPGSEAKVMLASIKSASEGIQLTGASRVVLFSVTWNPAVERQAISRAYRIGQQRVVHVYRLLMTDNDSYRHTSQIHKNKCSNYLFSPCNRKNGDAPGPSKPASADVVLEQLLQENIVKEAMQRDAQEQLGLDNAS